MKKSVVLRQWLVFLVFCGTMGANVSVALAARPVASPTPTIVEIVGTTIPTTPTVLYTVPAGQRFVLKDVRISCGFITFIHRDTSAVTAPFAPSSYGLYSYQSGIEFGPGQTVGISAMEACTGTIPLYELRGYLEAQ